MCAVHLLHVCKWMWLGECSWLSLDIVGNWKWFHFSSKCWARTWLGISTCLTRIGKSQGLGLSSLVQQLVPLEFIICDCLSQEACSALLRHSRGISLKSLYVKRGTWSHFFFFYCTKTEVIKNDIANLLLGSTWWLVISAHSRMTDWPHTIFFPNERVSIYLSY